jgi:hypothetical protein
MRPSNVAVANHVLERGFAMLRGREWLLDTTDAAWEALTEDWNHLPTDSYMPDGARYRSRRFGRFLFSPRSGHLKVLPHAAFYQARRINQFAGGVPRNFAPLRENTVRNTCLATVIRHDAARFGVTEAKAFAAPAPRVSIEMAINFSPST